MSSAAGFGIARAGGIALSLGLLAALVVLPDDLSAPARAALGVFGVAVILWVATKLDAAWVAFAGAVTLVFLGAADQHDLVEVLGHDIIWLMIGAFAIGAAIESSGLAKRITASLARRAANTAQLFWLTTFAILPLTFLIPSTSGRAAAMLPALALFPPDGERRRERHAFALLIPTVILVATTAAFTGAASHLLIEDLLAQRLGERFGIAEWSLWGLPFALASSALACAVILRMSLTAEERRRPLHDDQPAQRRITATEMRVIIIAVGTLALWFTSSWHGMEIATVSILAVLLLTVPRVGAMSFKAGVKAVNWHLILFVAGAMILGQALIDTQAAGWVVDHLFDFADLDEGESDTFSVLLAICVVSIASHLFITSHVARAAALGPPLLLVAQTAGADPQAVLFIASAGMNYCLTLPVCSKAFMVFQDVQGTNFEPRDLIRLSAVLAPLNLLLMIATYYAWWQWTGLELMGD